ncbi:MAG: aldehyde dehydrogenase [Bacteroidaceae bacterium]|nr:aldehyde dehydrogenase [Bacteroidaceae bacterium]
MKEVIGRIITSQRNFFNTNATKPVSYRIAALKRLRREIKSHEGEILDALYMDLGKSAAEAYMAEVAMVYGEIDTAISSVRKWSKPKQVGGTITTFPARNYIYHEPYGVVLVLAPWNYPFNLSLSPVVGAIAAGNCVILKSSKSSIHTANVVQKLINSAFDNNYLYCVDADSDYDDVLDQNYDYIFFTGSPNVGKTIMKKASEHLTPISLELGGKSPCIVDKDANIRMAAKRIIWGKCLNAGQTCISIDYVLVHRDVKDMLVEEMKNEIDKRYRDAQDSDSYPKIISQRHYERLQHLLSEEKTVIGGQQNPEKRKIAPALLVDTDFDKPVMQEEIFGPLLPVIAYTDIDTAIHDLKFREKPLACYIFTNNGKLAQRIIDEVSYGGGCVNDVILHISNHHLPFGGVGQSGMGGYHGRFGFETFSHKKGVVKNFTFIDLPLRYAPFNGNKFNILKKIL